jgi:hypothetical protein
VNHTIQHIWDGVRVQEVSQYGRWHICKERKQGGIKVMRSVTANGVNSAWGSLKDTAGEVEAAVGAITRLPGLRMGCRR